MSHFCLKCATELSDTQYICPSCHRNTYLDMLDDKAVISASSVLSSVNIELNTQWYKYRCGKNGATGHGFAAEDYNNLYDRLHGHSVEYAGRDNSTNGADRIVDGIHIQTKYCASPRATINAAFNDNGKGSYRYYTKDELHQPYICEVPSDQYEECIELMKDKIHNGQVEGVSDPEEASKIVKKGHCSYPQAKNMAKAGTINSLIFDMKTGAVIALTSLGVSFCVKMGIAALYCKDLDDFKCATQLCFLEGLQNGTITLSTSVLSTQIIRTQFGRNLVALVQKGSKSTIDAIYGTSMGRTLSHDIASKMWNKVITGGAAKNVVTKLVRLNAITGMTTFIAMSVPDIYRCFVSNIISKPQFIKNLVVNATSITGATIGGILGMKFGQPGAFAGAMIGGVVGNVLTKAVADKISKDDSVYMQELIKVAIVELSNDFLIQNDQEFQQVIKIIKLDKVIDTNLLRAMYQAGADNNNDKMRVDLAKLALERSFEIVARQRVEKPIRILENESLILESINSIDTPKDLPLHESLNEI